MADLTAPNAHAIVLLPVVGAIIGAVSGGAGMLTAKVAAQPWPALVAFALALVLSGAIHVDGFLDCCDALLASVSPQRRLEILRDPRHGTFAVVGMTLLALFWLAALHGIPPARLLLALTLSGALARLCALPVLFVFPNARAPQAERILSSPAEIAAFMLLAAGVLLLAAAIGSAAIAIVPGAAAAALVIGWLCARRLNGGITGDVCGAAIVLTEVAVLVALGIVPWR